MPKPLFCMSPWAELVLGIEGVCRTCCRSGRSFGDWREEDIDVVWHSEAYREMRRDIIAGRYPDGACQACHVNNTYTTPSRLLNKPLVNFAEQLKEVNTFGLMRIARLKELFPKTEMDDEAREILDEYYNILGKHAHVANQNKDDRHATLARKLIVIGNVLEDFLSHEEEPRHTGPIRQPNLIAVCNARCIHCGGNFTDQIRLGNLLDDGTRVPALNEEECFRILAHSESIIDFFHNGSEFLLSKHWKKVAEKLSRDNLLQLRLSTNGILLTPETSDYLLDNSYIGRLNVSLDGGTAETIEKVRNRVNYDDLYNNIKYFLTKAKALSKKFPVSFSFVLCSYNYKELKDIVELSHRFSEESGYPAPHILVQAMETKGIKAYGEWLKKHHHTTIDADDLKQSFLDMQAAAKKHGVTVAVFYQHHLDDFIEAGFPLPPLNYMETCGRY